MHIDLATLQKLASDPWVQMALAALAGMAITVGVNALAIYLRFRGRRGVERAKAQLAAAKLTPDQHDDVAMEMALARAEADDRVLDALAANLERIRATRVVPGPPLVTPSK